MFFPALLCTLATAPELWMPTSPGRAEITVAGGDRNVLTRTLSNKSLRLTMGNDGNHLAIESLLAKGPILQLTVPKLSGDIGLGKSTLSFERRLRAEPKSTIASHHNAGWEVVFSRPDADKGYQIEWSFELRDESNYVVESVKIGRKGGQEQDGTASQIDLVGFDSVDAKVVGKVPGSPIVAGDIFAGAAYPMAVSTVTNSHAKSSVLRKVPIEAGHPVTYQAVIGVSPSGQMRRAVLRYVERERSHPYRPLLHYNSWYDLGYFTAYTSDQCVDRINTFGQELSVKRGVKLDSFLFDDGWDDYTKVWKFSKDFPDEFQPLKKAAAKYGAGPGVWLSPWGGYGNPHKIRSEAGKAAGYEVDAQGYDLSGPKYYARFHEVTLDFVNHQGINQFKFDGTGSPDRHYPGSAFDSDFSAAISLIADLRKAQPDLFVNLTTGTWPSPFWLMIADSTWRGGSDHAFAGVGPYREQWITYRDGDTYHGVVQRGPLYPINSLMLHGIIYAQHAQHLNDDPSDDFRNDVWAYFATGTQLQEMYITPSLLTRQNWDDLAEAAKWARANANTLVDVHWIGGDPTKLEVYGHAAWTGGEGIIELRNPSDKPQAYALDPVRELELPSNVQGTFHVRSPWKGERSAVQDISIGKSRVVYLKPFEVLVLQGRIGR